MHPAPGAALAGGCPPPGAQYVEHYNHVRLNSAIGYLTPADKLNGLADVIFVERDRKLQEARQRRQLARQSEREIA